MLRSRSAVLLVCLVCAASLMALAPACVAQTKIEATDLAHHPFSTDFAGAGKLRLHVRSGEVHIVGTTDSKVSVELSGRSAWDARKLKVVFEHHTGNAEMRISGGPKNGPTITIHIPSDTDLYARVPFGEVHVENVAGNQDVELHAGDLTVDVGAAADYAHVDASVYSGELDAAPFREWKGGLFRSIKVSGSGRYRLHAHVGAGQLTLQSRGMNASTS